MHYELYIDVFFFTNFMMDSLLLFAVRAMLRIPARPWRVFLGGALAALMTCVAIVMPFQAGLKYLLFYALVPALRVWVGLGVRQRRDFAKAVGSLSREYKDNSGKSVRCAFSPGRENIR